MMTSGESYLQPPDVVKEKGVGSGAAAEGEIPPTQPIDPPQKKEKPTRYTSVGFSALFIIPAATYSPTQLPTQYHRRKRA